MKRSADRILVTHVGSLVRPISIRNILWARDHGQSYDQAAYEKTLQEEVAGAWRIKNFASVVGRENVIAGADCGFAQSYNIVRCHPSVQWAKLESLVEGARMASKELWGR